MATLSTSRLNLMINCKLMASFGLTPNSTFIIEWMKHSYAKNQSVSNKIFCFETDLNNSFLIKELLILQSSKVCEFNSTIDLSEITFIGTINDYILGDITSVLKRFHNPEFGIRWPESLKGISAKFKDACKVVDPEYLIKKKKEYFYLLSLERKHKKPFIRKTMHAMRWLNLGEPREFDENYMSSILTEEENLKNENVDFIALTKTEALQSDHAPIIEAKKPEVTKQSYNEEFGYE